jgi:hypothetical protein
MISFDLSVFKNPSTIIFLVICFVILIILFIICFLIIRFILSLLKKIFRKKPKLDKKSSADWITNQAKEEAYIAPKVQALGNMGDGVRKEGLAVNTEEPEANIREEFLGQKISGATTAGPVVRYTENSAGIRKKDLEKNVKQNYNEKEQKDIITGLNKLKGSGADATSFLKRQGLTEEDNAIGEKIKIPTAKKFSTEEPFKTGQIDYRKPGGFQRDRLRFSQVDEDVEDIKKDLEKRGIIAQNDLNWEKKTYEYLKKNKEEGKESEEDKELEELLKRSDVFQDELRWQSKASEKLREMMRSERSQKSEEINRKMPAGQKKASEKKPQNVSYQDASIFGGKEEISRIELRQKLRRDPKIYGAERAVGLTLSPVERANLEKQVFSQAYGRNISKTDLKWGIKKLGQKMINTKNISEKGKIRKEIKFFKKIGGIK